MADALVELLGEDRITVMNQEAVAIVRRNRVVQLLEAACAQRGIVEYDDITSGKPDR